MNISLSKNKECILLILTFCREHLQAIQTVKILNIIYLHLISICVKIFKEIDTI